MSERTLLGILATIVALPIFAFITAGILGQAALLYHLLGYWGIALFCLMPVVVAIGAFLVEDHNSWR